MDHWAFFSALIWAYNAWAVARSWWLSEPLGGLVAATVAVGCVMLSVDALMRFYGRQSKPENEKGARGRGPGRLVAGGGVGPEGP